MYCTPDDVILLTATETDTETLTALIGIADSKINNRISAAGLTPPSGDIPSLLRDASANWTVALLLNRMRIELSRPNNLNLGDISFGVGTDAEILRHETQADQYLSSWISAEMEAQGKSNTHFVVVEGT